MLGWVKKINVELLTCVWASRAIMSDVQRDSRVTSLTTRAGIRNSLVTILDQLQRCQKSLNEFLEVKPILYIFKYITKYTEKMYYNF